MNYQDRILWIMQYFHGATAAAKAGLGAMAILENCHPSLWAQSSTAGTLLQILL